MGFFEKVGRRAERLKQSVSEAAAEGAMYECADCGKGIFKEQEACPDCGSEAVIEREDLDEGAEPDTEVDSPEAADDEQAGEQEPDGTP